ncbi:MAG: PaaI family thioesterase [Clostridiales bacterium]|nr:PaaI family thioesterase [Candidatus Cacconaster stercorequi]
MDNDQRQALYRTIMQRANLPGTFTAENGISITAVGDGWAEGELQADSHHMNPMQIVHGGCLCTMMDQVAGAAACTRGSTCRTINCDIRYLNPGPAGCLRSRAEAIHMGHGTAVFHARVTDEAGNICADGIYTFRLKQGAYPINP